jgi:hypothetical protein
MKSSIYISTEKIEVVGYAGRSVKRFVTYNLPEGTMINGMITDSALLTECLTSMRAENPDLFTSPSLIVDGSAILSRRIITPRLNHKRYLQLVRDDFADSTDNTGNLVCGYYKLNAQDGQDAILACAVDKGLVDAYMSTFKSAGIKLSSIHVGVEALINLIDSRPELKNASFVLTLIDGFTAVSMIFEKGNNVFMSRARLYGDAKEQVFQNVLDNLNGLINFNRSQSFSEITQCYYLGVSDADMRLIEALNPYAGIQMNNLNLFKDNSVLPPEAHFAYLNTLMPSDSINLITARKELDKHIKSAKPKNLLPLLLLVYLLILALPVGYMWWQVREVDREIEGIESFLSDPSIEVRQSELEAKQNDTREYSRVESQFNDLIDWEDSLIRVSSRMLDLFIIEHSAYAAVTQFDYDEKSNTVRVGAVSPDPDSATRYVDALMRSDMVLSIRFTGYVVNNDDGTTFSLDITLAEKERAVEEAE